MTSVDTSTAADIVGGMDWRGLVVATCMTVLVLSSSSCRRGADRPPPPDARRPKLKTEAELAAARAERIRRGEVVPTSAPVVAAERERVVSRRQPAGPRPSRNSIRSDILMVNESVLTVAEVLYPLRDWIEQTRASQTPRGFREQLTRRVRDHVRQEIGSLLLYSQAKATLSDPQLAGLDEAVDREIDQRVSRDFGGSVARLESHLAQHGLTVEQFRQLVQRQMLVSSYTRETLMPQIHIRRDELLGYYRRNLKRYCTEETRELLMIELPFAAFLPEGTTWTTATPSAPAQAKLKAMRRARAAHQALSERDFRDVAREFSRGVQTQDGGSWGQIGQPLQPPYDELSRRIFEFEEGQYSAPIETDLGWYIVGCGRIEPATKRPFVEIQEEIRAELENQRFAQVASDYILRLAEKATISDLNAFINSAVERATVDRPDRTSRD